MAIGDGWTDGAWVDAGWVDGAWAKGAVARKPRIIRPFIHPGHMNMGGFIDVRYLFKTAKRGRDDGT